MKLIPDSPRGNLYKAQSQVIIKDYDRLDLNNLSKMILEKMERAKMYSKAVRKREIAHEWL